MQRLIARILFLVSLLGIFVPVALAIGAPAPHQCCVRKLRAGAGKTQVQAEDHSENCCPPRTPSLWATPVSVVVSQRAALVTLSSTTPQSSRLVSTCVAYKSVRAPPALSIA